MLGVVLLIGGAIFISDQSRGGGLLSQVLKETQTASTYWANYYANYGGWPAPTYVAVSANSNQRYGCGVSQCGATPNCANPATSVMSISGGPSSGAALGYNNGAVTNSGSATSRGSDPVTLDWACQPYITIQYIETYDSHRKCQPYAPQTRYYSSDAQVIGPDGAVLSTGINGSISVTPTGPVGSTQVYRVACNAAVALSVPVTILANPPTLGITGNGQNPATATVGDTVVIHGTYAAAPGDTLLQTALNDSNSNALPGVLWQPPTDKSYTFVPTAPGSYVFYPAVQTQSYPTPWNNYGASLTVTVGCPAHATNKSGSCVCDQFFTMQGGSCVLTCPANSTPGDNTCICPANATMQNGQCVCGQFFVMQGGSCVLTCPVNSSPSGPTSCTCGPGYIMAGSSCLLVDACLNIPGAQTAPIPNSSRDAQGNCGCNTDYTMKNYQCVLAAQLSIDVNGETTAKIRAGNTATITWTTANVAAGSCSVVDSTGATISSGKDNTPTPAPTKVINNKTVFTLSCTDLQGDKHTVSATANLVPTVIEF